MRNECPIRLRSSRVVLAVGPSTNDDQDARFRRSVGDLPSAWTHPAQGGSGVVSVSNPTRLAWQRLARRALELERARQKDREEFAGLTEDELVTALVTAQFDAERHAPR